jgi:hypothetical protein
MNQLQSFIAGRWLGQAPGQTLRSAINGQPVARTHADAIDFAEALAYARGTGLPALLALDFQQRAARLKALAKYLVERKEELYAISAHTGATRADSWIDVEGGTGTLFAYASMGSAELPSSNVVHEGPVVPLGKNGGFAGTHILVPRRGVAVHINAFNFPIWGLLEKFAPTFLAGMLPHRGPGAPDRPVRHPAGGQPAARHRRHGRPARPPDWPGHHHLHRLGRYSGQAARAPQRDPPERALQRRGRLAQLRHPGPGCDPG